MRTDVHTKIFDRTSYFNFNLYNAVFYVQTKRHNIISVGDLITLNGKHGYDVPRRRWP